MSTYTCLVFINAPIWKSFSLKILDSQDRLHIRWLFPARYHIPVIAWLMVISLFDHCVDKISSIRLLNNLPKSILLIIFFFCQQRHRVKSIQCAVKILISRVKYIYWSKNELLSLTIQRAFPWGPQWCHCHTKTQKHFIIVLQDKLEWIFSDSFAVMRGDRRNPVVARSMIEGVLESLLKLKRQLSVLAKSSKLGDSASASSL